MVLDGDNKTIHHGTKILGLQFNERANLKKWSNRTGFDLVALGSGLGPNGGLSIDMQRKHSTRQGNKLIFDLKRRNSTVRPTCLPCLLGHDANRTTPNLNTLSTLFK